MANYSACPVCSIGVYTDANAPMSKSGTANPATHSCVETGTWRERTRFGGTVERLRSRLLATHDEALVAWPRVAALKERAAEHQPLT